ncbi:hypothetical protein, partial [Pseudomonas sp. MWU13-2100]|uniref:hypothetical protein n=1 Tax=Pseudomonas sp. MWU13-2100 TaxID=2935075 RepID=UPI00200DA359
GENTLPFQLLPRFDELKRTACQNPQNLCNSLNLKGFSVSTAPEVVRIIEPQDFPSTLIFTFLS